MKRLIIVAFLAMVFFGLTGCATSSAYLRDRKNDAQDVVTASCAKGAGFRVRVGPVHVGAIDEQDSFGLRGGTVGQAANNCMESELLVLPQRIEEHRFFSLELYKPITNNRGKDFGAVSKLPFITTGLQGERSFPFYYLTQIEIEFGIGYTVRLGGNIGELLDFMLGWFWIDIFKDDVGNAESTAY
ncbi:MAG: hypothetical protein C0404_05135 [Verrucomicrobia bacterium]|nr:hypothetical protein [Verrucomicrobiota bacterium]